MPSVTKLGDQDYQELVLDGVNFTVTAEAGITELLWVTAGSGVPANTVQGSKIDPKTRPGWSRTNNFPAGDVYYKAGSAGGKSRVTVIT